MIIWMKLTVCKIR